MKSNMNFNHFWHNVLLIIFLLIISQSIINNGLFSQIQLGTDFRLHELSINPFENKIISSSFNKENENIGVEIRNISSGEISNSFGFGIYHSTHEDINLVSYCNNYSQIVAVDADGMSGKRRIDVYDSKTLKKTNTINLISSSGMVPDGFSGQIDFREHFVFIAYYNAIYRINILTSKVETIFVFTDKTKSYAYEGLETFSDNEFVVSARTDEGFELEYIKIIDLDKGSYNRNTLTLPNKGYNHISVSTSESNCFISTIDENVTKTDNTAGNEEKMQFDDKIYGSYYTNGREFYYSWYSKDVHIKSSTFNGKITLDINPYKLIVLEDVIYYHDIQGNLYTKKLNESIKEKSNLAVEKDDTKSNKEIDIIKIGNQTWMRYNLNVRKFSNGDRLRFPADCYVITAHNNAGAKAAPSGTNYQWEYNVKENDSTLFNVNGHGKIYMYSAVFDNQNRNICPNGFHIPSVEEWQELIDYVGGNDIAGKNLKSLNGWSDQRVNGNNNSSGFSILASGYWDGPITASAMGTIGRYFTSSKNKNAYNGIEVSFIEFRYDSNEVKIIKYSDSYSGSCRCIKD